MSNMDIVMLSKSVYYENSQETNTCSTSSTIEQKVVEHAWSW